MSRAGRWLGGAMALVFALGCLAAGCGSSGQKRDGDAGATGDAQLDVGLGSEVGTEVGGGMDAAPLPDGSTPRPSWAMIFEGGAQTTATATVTDRDGNVIVALGFDQSLRVGSDTLTSAGGTDALVVKVTPAGEIRWRRTVAGPGADWISSLAIDPSGDVWAIGKFEQALAVATPPLQSLGSSDVLLLRLAAATGDIVSARGFGSTAADWGNSVAVDGAGRMALAGWFRDRLSLDDRLVAPDAMNWDGFLAVQAEGAARPDWVRVAGGFGQDGISTVVIAPGGDVAITGIYDGASSFGCGQLASTALSHAFVARYTADGTCRFSKGYGRLGWNGAGAAAFAATGDLVVTGAFEGPIDLGSGETTSHCNQIYCRDAFVVRLDLRGSHVWSHTWGDATGDDSIGGVAFTDSGSIYSAGTFYGTLDVGSGNVMTTAGGSDGFAVLLSAGGAAQWAGSFGGAGDDSLGAVAVEPSGVYLAGRAGGALTTPGLQLLTPGGAAGGALLIRLERRDGATP